MARFGALFTRRTFADDGYAADQRRLVSVSFGNVNCFVNGVGVMAVNIGDNLPAVAFETLGSVIGKSALNFTINGNAIVVVECDELSESERTGKGANLVRNTFH